jgi:hypothetical protein
VVVFGFCCLRVGLCLGLFFVVGLWFLVFVEVGFVWFFTFIHGALLFSGGCGCECMLGVFCFLVGWLFLLGLF